MESGEYVCFGFYLGFIMIIYFGKLGEFFMRIIESLIGLVIFLLLRI